jgi:hypothetical protein
MTGARREELAVDDRGRLARVEQRLETLQEEVAQLRELLRARPESGQRTGLGSWSAQASTAESSTTPGGSDVLSVPGARRELAKKSVRQQAKPRRDQDPIGCVEIGVERLGEDLDNLFRILGAPVPDLGPGLVLPYYTGPRAPEQGQRSGDQTDGRTGDDMLSDPAPSKGPGPRLDEEQRVVDPDDEDPRFGPGV